MPRNAKLEPVYRQGKWTLNVPPRFSPAGKRTRPTFPTRELAEECALELKRSAETSPSIAEMAKLAKFIPDHVARVDAGFSTPRPTESTLPPEGPIFSKVRIPDWVEKEVEPWLKVGLTSHDIYEALRIFTLSRKNLAIDPIEAIEDRARQLIAEIQTFIQQDTSEAERAVVALRDVGVAAAKLIEQIQRSSHDKLRAPLLKVAHESGSWPVAVSAIKERLKDTMEHIHQLDLGKSLPFRTSAHPVRGRPRSMADGQAALALEVAVALENARPTGEGDRRAAKFRRELMPWQDGSWEQLASRLPEFDGKPATQQKWLEAGMLWLEAICGGAWDTYPWPARIRNALGYKSRGDASPKRPKSALKTALKEGLKSLVKP